MPDFSESHSLFRIQCIAFMTLVRKELYRVLRIWTQTLLPPVITMILYFLIFGRFLGTHIGSINGVSYIGFIVPGLIMMAILTNSYSNVVSSVFSAKFQKSIEELLISPMSHLTILLGYLSGGVMRGLLVGGLVSLCAVLFKAISIQHWGLMILTTLLTSVLFALGGFLNALVAKKFDDIAIVPTFILTPLTYLGGVFYPLSSLPPFWQKVSLFNPIVYLVNLYRYSFVGISDISVGTAFTVLMVMTILFFSIAWVCVRKGIGLRH